MWQRYASRQRHVGHIAHLSGGLGKQMQSGKAPAGGCGNLEAGWSVARESLTSVGLESHRSAYAGGIKEDKCP